MSFRLVPKSATLNDHERRNGPFCVISPNSNLEYMAILSLKLVRATMHNSDDTRHRRHDN